MTEQEKIEKLCEKAEITQDEARAALEATDWDLLDAIVLLEKQGRVKGASSSHSTRTEAAAEEEVKTERPRFSAHASGVWAQIQHIIHIGNTNNLVVTRKGKEALRLPVTALVLLLIFGHLWTLPCWPSACSAACAIPSKARSWARPRSTTSWTRPPRPRKTSVKLSRTACARAQTDAPCRILNILHRMSLKTANGRKRTWSEF